MTQTLEQLREGALVSIRAVLQTKDPEEIKREAIESIVTTFSGRCVSLGKQEAVAHLTEQARYYNTSIQAEFMAKEGSALLQAAVGENDSPAK